MSTIEKEKAQEQTLEAFNKFLCEEIPHVLKRNVAEGKKKSFLDFSLQENGKIFPAKMAMFEYTSDTNTYSVEVIKEEFMRYMRSICLSGYVGVSSDDGKGCITIDTAKLINYLMDNYPEIVQFPEIDWSSDFTYAVFQDFLFNEIPEIIDRGKKEGQAISYFEFSLEETRENFPEEMAIFNYESDTNAYCAKVNKDEFIGYLSRMPYMRYRKPTDDDNEKSMIAFNTSRLNDYYLGELQREEYQGGKAI